MARATSIAGSVFRLPARSAAAGGDDPGPRVEPDTVSARVRGERLAQPLKRTLGGDDTGLFQHDTVRFEGSRVGMSGPL